MGNGRITRKLRESGVARKLRESGVAAGANEVVLLAGTDERGVYGTYRDWVLRWRIARGARSGTTRLEHDTEHSRGELFGRPGPVVRDAIDRAVADRLPGAEWQSIYRAIMEKEGGDAP